MDGRRITDGAIVAVVGEEADGVMAKAARGLRLARPAIHPQGTRALASGPHHGDKGLFPMRFEIDTQSQRLFIPFMSWIMLSAYYMFCFKSPLYAISARLMMNVENVEIKHLILSSTACLSPLHHGMRSAQYAPPSCVHSC
jgi:hypothetical protein